MITYNVSAVNFTFAQLDTCGVIIPKHLEIERKSIVVLLLSIG